MLLEYERGLELLEELKWMKSDNYDSNLHKRERVFFKNSLHFLKKRFLNLLLYQKNFRESYHSEIFDNEKETVKQHLENLRQMRRDSLSKEDKRNIKKELKKEERKLKEMEKEEKQLKKKEANELKREKLERKQKEKREAIHTKNRAQTNIPTKPSLPPEMEFSSFGDYGVTLKPAIPKNSANTTEETNDFKKRARRTVSFLSRKN